MLLLGRYQLIRQIGRGGMAEVWEARAQGDRGFTRRVAVKRLTATGPAMERMFVDEARLASRLHHPNVVAVLDFGVADGVPFQVLEYVDGLDAEALRKLAEERGALAPVAAALHVAAEVARGLDHAHRARGEDGRLLGLVHRDVSPNNVLVAWTGEVKLGDFGIAFARDRGEATEAGMTKGKLSYMAPEQMTRGELDARTDIFGLGCALHALVTGASPLAGENRMADLLAGQPLPLAAELPDDVRAIVARATQRSRSQRYEDAAGFAAACDQAARARSGGDPRRVFLEWLETLRPAPASAAGALDALFEAPAPLPALATTVAEEPRPPPPGARFRMATAVAAVAVVIAVAVAAAFGLRSRPAEEEPRLEPVSFRVLPPPGEAVAPPVAVPAPAPKRPRAQAPAPAPAPTGTGVLQVGGEIALRKEIFVDGKSAGFAPKTLEVAVGPHQVSLRDADGSVVGSRRVEITSWDTRSAPARWTPGAAEEWTASGAVHR
ncbi:MAG TPA: serine/threonine-protein kinase [Myxococcales bacterium]|nr:serine/threonine-protein kinase [Myxococcales bacterium]